MTVERLSTMLVHRPRMPYNKKVIKATVMVTDTAQDAQIRRSILKVIELMDLRLLQRIAYEVRCEEMGIHPDSWKLYPEEIIE